MPASSPSRPAEAEKWLAAFPRLKIGVLGDFAADHYLVGSTSRISREAPVLILKKRNENVLPGQAGNSAVNLASLGVQCTAFGVVGDDAQGDALLTALQQRGVDTTGLAVSTECRTIVKTRILAGAHHAALQQVIRLDDDEGLVFSDLVMRDMRERLTDALPDLDALLVSDYGYGTANLELWKLAGGAVRGSVLRGGRKKKSVLRVLDSRYGLGKFKQADVITPNETEVFEHLGIRNYRKADPLEAGRKLMDLTKCKGLIMTRGNEGMIVFDEKGKTTQVPIFGSDEVTDVTGAGDTVSAVVTAVRAAGGSLAEAARLANVAAGLVVMKLGAASVTPGELRTALSDEP